MHVILLGTAAGGGFPQWNCWCPVCRTARTEPQRAHPRTQSSAAVSADGESWFLLNASPDVRAQLSLIPHAAPDTPRHVPIEGIVLTDAELDHTLGIPLLREARRLDLYATGAVRDILEGDSHLVRTTRAFASVTVHYLALGEPTDLLTRAEAPSGLRVECFTVPGSPPRFATATGMGHTVGLLVHDVERRSTLAFVPGCGAITEEVLGPLERADAVLFDGTCWKDDELQELDISASSALEMGHVPISGDAGSLTQLARLRAGRRIYTHINNTNPVLLQDSAQRRAVTDAGVEVGEDGMRFTV